MTSCHLEVTVGRDMDCSTRLSSPSTPYVFPPVECRKLVWLPHASWAAPSIYQVVTLMSRIPTFFLDPSHRIFALTPETNRLRSTLSGLRHGIHWELLYCPTWGQVIVLLLLGDVTPSRWLRIHTNTYVSKPSCWDRPVSSHSRTPGYFLWEHFTE